MATASEESHRKAVEEFGPLAKELGWSVVLSRDGSFYFVNGRPEQVSAFILLDDLAAEPVVVRRGDERVAVPGHTSANLLMLGMFRAFMKVQAVGVIPDVRPDYDRQRKLLREMVARLPG